MGFDMLYPLDDVSRIKDGLVSFLAVVESERVNMVSEEVVDQYSRKHAASKLAMIFNDCTNC